MKLQGNQLPTIEALEAARIVLHEKHKRSAPFFFMTPIVVFLSVLFAMQVIPVAFALGFATTVVSILSYHFIFRSTFKELSSKVKQSLLAQFLDLYHPDIKYTYSHARKDVRRIVRNSKLISADQYHEEDVIQGNMKGVSFYISEIDLKKQGKNSSHSIFKGILFKIRIPGKNFPKSQIQNKPDLLKRLFNNFIKDEEFGFWHESQDDQAFHRELNSIFPFVQHLMRHQGDVRIATEGDTITILLKSDMKFLDDPEPSLKQSFLQAEYHSNIGKQLNSLLYIVEAISDGLSPSQFEEKLELKERELIIRTSASAQSPREK